MGLQALKPFLQILGIRDKLVVGARDETDGTWHRSLNLGYSRGCQQAIAFARFSELAPKKRR